MKKDFFGCNTVKYLLVTLTVFLSTHLFAAKQNTDIRQLSEQEIKLLVPEILSKAKSGDPDSQLYSSFIFMKGIGVRQNFDQALNWYKTAAKNNQPEAQFGMGWNSMIGRYGLKKDPRAALSWFLKSAEQGYNKSYPMVAQIYRGVRFPGLRNNEKAFYWYKKTAKEGDYKSKGMAEFTVGCYLYFGGANNEVDKKTAINHFKISKNLGYKTAERYLRNPDLDLLSYLCAFK